MWVLENFRNIYINQPYTIGIKIRIIYSYYMVDNLSQELWLY